MSRNNRMPISRVRMLSVALITLAAVADHSGLWPNDISRLERGLKGDDTLADSYRAWLSAA